MQLQTAYKPYEARIFNWLELGGLAVLLLTQVLSLLYLRTETDPDVGDVDHWTLGITIGLLVLHVLYILCLIYVYVNIRWWGCTVLSVIERQRLVPKQLMHPRRRRRRSTIQRMFGWFNQRSVPTSSPSRVSGALASRATGATGSSSGVVVGKQGES